MSTTSRRQFLTGSISATGAIALGASSCSVLSGEGEAAGSAADGQEATLPTHIEASDPQVEAYYVSDVDEMPDVYTDNPTEFFQSVDRDPDDGGDTVTTFQLMWGTPPVDREQNEYWQELEKRLGVTFEPQFVPAPTFDSKFSTMLASGNIPDLVFVDDQSATQLQAIRDGAFADLSEVLGGDGIQQWPNLAARTPDIWQASLKNGRIYQIPSVIARITNLVVMRRDAFEETSIGPEPADADELMTALTEISQTPRDGQKIYGFTDVDKDRPLFYRLFRVGSEWQLDDSGKLVHMSETENYREMLEWLNAAWSAGVFDPNSLTPESENTAWRSGLSYAAVTETYGGSLFADAAEQHDGAELDYFSLPGFDGTAPLIIQNVPYGRSTAISSAAAEDEERLHRVLNVLDYLSAPWGSEENAFIGRGIEGRHWEYGEMNVSVPIEEHEEELGVEYVGVESGRPRYGAHPDAVDTAERFTEHMRTLVENSETRVLEGLESASETFIQKGPQLAENLTDFENGVISGRSDPSELSDFISTYMSQGGEDIRAEYETALEEADR